MMHQEITRGRHETGDSLIELLIALAIISISLSVFVLSLSTGALGVRNSDRLTTANNLVLSQLETIKGTDYVTGTLGYPTIDAGNYTLIQELAYWNGTTFTPNPGDDQGMQQITVTISYNGANLVSVSNYKVNR